MHRLFPITWKFFFPITIAIQCWINNFLLTSFNFSIPSLYLLFKPVNIHLVWIFILAIYEIVVEARLGVVCKVFAFTFVFFQIKRILIKKCFFIVCTLFFNFLLILYKHFLVLSSSLFIAESFFCWCLHLLNILQKILSFLLL